MKERNRLGFRAIKSGEARRASSTEAESSARVFSRRRPSSLGGDAFRTEGAPSFDSFEK